MGVGEHLQHVLTHADDAELHAGGAGVHLVRVRVRVRARVRVRVRVGVGVRVRVRSAGVHEGNAAVLLSG